MNAGRADGARNQKYTINQYTLLYPKLCSLNVDAFKIEHIIGTVFHWHRIPLVLYSIGTESETRWIPTPSSRELFSYLWLDTSTNASSIYHVSNSTIISTNLFLLLNKEIVLAGNHPRRKGKTEDKPARYEPFSRRMSSIARGRTLIRVGKYTAIEETPTYSVNHLVNICCTSWPRVVHHPGILLMDTCSARQETVE
jgi:hypothetical protein